MKLFKLLLITLLTLVTVLFGYDTFREKASGRQDGPTITCSDEVLTLSVSDGEEVLLSGVTAKDKQDGDLTGHILIQGVSRQITEDNMTTVTYLVFDSDGNAASVTRNIRYTDYTKPRFTISEALTYAGTQNIALLDRLQAIDCIDGDITNNIRVSSMTTTGDPEIYTIDVQVTNSFSDTSRLTLPLVIYSTYTSRPVIHLTDYLVYLNRGASFHSRQYLKEVELSRYETGEISDVKIESKVDTSTPGTYMVYYRYYNEGNASLAVLTVVVE